MTPEQELPEHELPEHELPEQELPEHELLNTIEEIRAKQFTDLPAELVKQIAVIERDYTDNRQEAYKRIAAAIDAHMAATMPPKQAGG